MIQIYIYDIGMERKYAENKQKIYFRKYLFFKNYRNWRMITLNFEV